MLEFRLVNDEDLPLIESWMTMPHVKKWYEITHMGVSIENWMLREVVL